MICINKNMSEVRRRRRRKVNAAREHHPVTKGLNCISLMFLGLVWKLEMSQVIINLAITTLSTCFP